jgi:hypothetical protein
LVGPGQQLVRVAGVPEGGRHVHRRRDGGMGVGVVVGVDGPRGHRQLPAEGLGELVRAGTGGLLLGLGSLGRHG